MKRRIAKRPKKKIITDPQQLVDWIVVMLEEGYEISVHLGR